MALRQRPVGALLDVIFGNTRIAGGLPRWITLPPWPWFFHYSEDIEAGLAAGVQLIGLATGKVSV